MRFAFVTDELPRPGLAGHLAFNHAIIAWLRDQGHQVTILLTRPRLRFPIERCAGRVAGPRIRQLGPWVIALHPRDQLQILAKTALSRLPSAGNRLAAGLRQRRHGGADTVLGSFITAAQAAWCARAIAAAPPDAILVDTIFRAAVLRAPALAAINSVIIAHDVFHRRYAALTAAGFNVAPQGLSLAAEVALLRPASAVAAIQPEEAAILARLLPGQAVFTAAMPALPVPRPETTARLADRLVFVGSAALPNLDGLRWFFQSIWPSLRRWRPHLSLDLVGDCGAALSQLPDGVNRLGRIADLAPILHRATLAIAPLRVGSGLKIKLLDYARHGLVTIATPPGLAGFAADPAAPFIAAANATGFAAAVIRQLDNPAGGEQRALDYIATHYSLAASFAGLKTALRLPDGATSRESVATSFP